MVVIRVKKNYMKSGEILHNSVVNILKWYSIHVWMNSDCFEL